MYIHNTEVNNVILIMLIVKWSTHFLFC
uniref:Uncharacterized protein n=1 Tax=Lepeophtheirus salmonis TaxID=72036 RepID=A0A0K2UUP7_LEPSM